MKSRRRAFYLRYDVDVNIQKSLYTALTTTQEFRRKRRRRRRRSSKRLTVALLKLHCRSPRAFVCHLVDNCHYTVSQTTYTHTQWSRETPRITIVANPSHKNTHTHQQPFTTRDKRRDLTIYVPTVSTSDLHTFTHIYIHETCKSRVVRVEKH